MSKQRKNRRPRVTVTTSSRSAASSAPAVVASAPGPTLDMTPEVTKAPQAAADAAIAEAERFLREAETQAARTRAEADTAAARIVSLAESKAADITATAHVDATTRAQAQIRASLKAAEETADELREQARQEARQITAAAESGIADRRFAAENAFTEARQQAEVLVQDGRERAASVIAEAQHQAEQRINDADGLLEQARVDSEKARSLRESWESKAKTKPKPTDSDELLGLSAGEIVIFIVVIALAGVVGTLGLYSSFDSVAAKGAQWGFGGRVGPLPDGWILPVGIDLAIPAFTGAHLLLIRKDMPLPWVRFVPWALSAVTCYLNTAAVTDTEPAARVAHGVMPALWVVLSEVAAHAYASYIGAVTGKRMDKIRPSRWLLAFPSTFVLWRRMVLWEITSYAEALDTERNRLRHTDRLRRRYGRLWWWKAPRSERFTHIHVRGADTQVPGEAKGPPDAVNGRRRMRSDEGEGTAAKPSANDHSRKANAPQAKADPQGFTSAEKASSAAGETANGAANGKTNPASEQRRSPRSPVATRGEATNEPSPVREQAKAEVREAFANRRPVDSKKLAEKHGFGRRWAQLLIKEVRNARKGEANGADREAHPANGEAPEDERDG